MLSIILFYRIHCHLQLAHKDGEVRRRPRVQIILADWQHVCLSILWMSERLGFKFYLGLVTYILDLSMYKYIHLHEKLSCHGHGQVLAWTRLSMYNLGVILDSEFNFEPHIRNITKTAFYHLKNIDKINSSGPLGGPF